MIYAIIISIIIIILLLSFLIIKNQLNQIKNYNFKFDEIKKDMEINQEKQITLLTKISKSIKNTTKEKLLTNLPKIKNKNLNVKELDKELHKLNIELKDFVMSNNIELTKEDKNIINLIKSNSIEMKALKEYHNIQADKYNKTIKKITFLLTKIITNSKKESTFLIEKEFEFEILKPQN